MSIGVLYESREWSNIRIEELLSLSVNEVESIDIEDYYNSGKELEIKHSLYVNRVFPSADMRDNKNSLKITKGFLELLSGNNIPVINSYNAFLYDCSKSRTYDILNKHGFKIPDYICLNSKRVTPVKEEWKNKPVVLKKDCGGRSFELEILKYWRPADNLTDKLSNDIWVVQEYIHPEKGYVTRVEVINNKIMAVLKRYIGRRGISSYSTASKYEIYKNCPEQILENSVNIMKTLEIEMGSMDFIETESGKFYLIDVNATSNFTPDYIPLLGFDPIKKMTDYVLTKYKSLGR